MTVESVIEKTILALFLDMPDAAVFYITEQARITGASLNCQVLQLEKWQQVPKLDPHAIIATTPTKLERLKPNERLILEQVKARGASFLLVFYGYDDFAATSQRSLQRMTGMRLHYIVVNKDVEFAPLPSPEGGRLTSKEMEILRHIAEGEENAAIGRALYLSTLTVKSYLTTIFRKLGANDRAEAVAIGFRRGYLS